MTEDPIVAEILREQIEDWNRQRYLQAVEIVSDQIQYWQRQGFTPVVCMLLLTGSPRVPRARRDPDWKDVADIAVDAYREIQKGRLVSYSLIAQ